MLKAQLHHKLAREIWDSHEDLLTSAVLGTLANLPDRLAASILNSVEPVRGSPLLLTPPLKWDFWPWWATADATRDGCEPDVVVDDGQTLCVIEAKVTSDFGSEPGKRDQLDREWRHATRVSAERGCQSTYLIALTAHSARPAEQINAQLKGIDAEPSVGWLSWTAIARHLEGARVGFDDCVGRWIGDVCTLIEQVGLGPFGGFSELADVVRRLDKSSLDFLAWGKPGLDFLGLQERMEGTLRLSSLTPFLSRLNAVGG